MARGRRRGGTRLGGVALLAGLVAAALPVAAGAADPGSWTVTATPSNVRAVHVAVLRTGKVLLVAGSGNDRNRFNAGSFRTSEWDPATGALTTVATPWDAFCSGHSFLSDGRLLVAGGTTAYPSPATNNNSGGSKRAYLYDPVTRRYQASADMHLARWYPTVTELGDGRQFVLSGLDETGRRTTDYEIFDGSTWTQPAPAPSAYQWQPMYPALHLMRDGRLFYSGVNTFGGDATEVPPGLWNLATNSYQNVGGLTDGQLRDQGASVLLPPAQDQRVMVIGGGNHPSGLGSVSSTAIADLKAATPTFTPGPPIDTAKMYVNAVVLPDSTVLETGGATKSVQYGGAAVRSTQIYHPKTNSWQKVATPTVDRVYHSSAVLLPDGRVATFGGNPSNSFEMRIEVFTPPYLETGTARPTVTAGPSDVRYGDYAAFRTTQAVPITSVVLVRPQATTHQSDPNQRLVDVAFTRTTTGVSVTMPTEPNLAPPGWYMLFAVDANGVPSIAKWVRLHGPAATPRGGYVLDGYGALHPFAVGGVGAPTATSGPSWPGWDIARGVARRTADTGYVLDGWGGIHGFGAGGATPPAVTGAPYWAGWDIARGIALVPDGTGGYVLDGFGGIHPFAIGNGPVPPTPKGTPYWSGRDRARGISLLPDGSGGYVVDSSGRLYPFRIGSGLPAPKVTAPYAPGAAVRGVAVQVNGAAGQVLDAVGGLHPFTIAGGVALPTTAPTNWVGWPLARGIAM